LEASLVTTQYTIEDAALKDLEQIVDIYNSTILSRTVTADLEQVTTASKRKWFDEHSSDFRPLWVMKINDNVAAWLSFQSFYGRAAYNATAEISIYISLENRSKGIGSILLEKAIQESSRLHINKLVGFVFAHNEPSLALLKKYKFEQWGYLPEVALLDGVDRDLVILGKRV
jgi:L-amino acid N-acyltransferase YncA